MAMSRSMRRRCQDTAKQTAGKPEGRTDDKNTRGPNKQLENQKAEFYRYCVANVKKNAKLMRVLFRKADVETDAKPMSGWTRSRCQDNAKPMSRQMRSRCQDECEADVKATAKPMSRRHSPAHVAWKYTRIQTNRRQMQTRSPIYLSYVCIDY